MTDECQQCEKSYKRLSQHWSMSSKCEYPEIDERKWDILTGLLMGDGSIITQSHANPRFRVAMINKEFLQWVDEELGVLSTGVKLWETAEDNADRAMKNKFSTTVNKEKYHDMYVVKSRNLPVLEGLSSWYSTGEKIFNKNVSLNSLIASMWYVCDGGVSWSSSGPQVEIGTIHADRYAPLLEDAGYSVGTDNKRIYLATSDRDDFLNWIDGPLPGFRYKWEIDDRVTYDKLMKKSR